MIYDPGREGCSSFSPSKGAGFLVRRLSALAWLFMGLRLTVSYLTPPEGAVEPSFYKGKGGLRGGGA